MSEELDQQAQIIQVEASSNQDGRGLTNSRNCDNQKFAT